MATISSLFVELKLQAENFNNGLRNAQREVKEFEKTVRPTTKLLNDLGRAGITAGAALTAGLTAPIAAIAGVGVAFNAMQEQAQVAFTTLLGDGGKARVFLEELKDFAAKTPFEFPDLVRATQRLMAMGFEAGEVRPLLTAVGNAVAALGGGAAEIDRVTLALGQMQGRGRVATQEMNQLTEVGIPAWRMLAQGFGVAEEKLRSMVEKGMVPAGEAVRILTASMTSDFDGMMEKQAKTFNGLISTIKDETRFLAGELTTGLFEALKGPAETVVRLLHSLREATSGWTNETKATVAVVAALAAAIGPLLVVLGTMAFSVSQLIVVLPTLKIALVALAGPIGVAAVAVTGLVAAFIYFHDYIKTAVLTVMSAFMTAIGGIITAAEKAARAIGQHGLANQLGIAANSVRFYRDETDKQVVATMAQIMTIEQTQKALQAETIGRTAATAATAKHTAALVENNKEISKGRGLPSAYMMPAAQARGRHPWFDADVAARDAADIVDLLRQTEDERFRMSQQTNTRIQAELEVVTNARVREILKGRAEDDRNWREQMDIDRRRAEDMFQSVKRTASDTFLAIFRDGEFRFRALADTVKGIFATLANELLSTLTAKLITPLVDRISGALLGGKGGAGGAFGGLLGGLGTKLGGVFGGGGAIGTINPGTGALVGGGAAVSGAAIAATAGIAAAAMAAIGVVKSQAHHEANTFVKTLQNPFGSGLAGILASGGSSADKLVGVNNLFDSFTSSANRFASGGSDERRVVAQAMAHLVPLIEKIRDDLKATKEELQAATHPAAPPQPAQIMIQMDKRTVARLIVDDLYALTKQQGMKLFEGQFAVQGR